MHFPVIIILISPASGVIFKFCLIVDENSLSKQNSPRWDAAFCGVTSGAILFCMSLIRDARLNHLKGEIFFRIRVFFLW